MTKVAKSSRQFVIAAQASDLYLKFYAKGLIAFTRELDLAMRFKSRREAERMCSKAYLENSVIKELT